MKTFIKRLLLWSLVVLIAAIVCTVVRDFTGYDADTLYGYISATAYFLIFKP